MAIEHKNFNDNHANKILTGKDDSLKLSLINKSGINDRILTTATNDSNPWVSSAAKKKLDSIKKQREDDDSLLSQIYS